MLVSGAVHVFRVGTWNLMAGVVRASFAFRRVRFVSVLRAGMR